MLALRKPSAHQVQHFLDRQAKLGLSYAAVGATASEAASDGPGKGAEFTVCLPLEPEALTLAAQSVTSYDTPALRESSGRRFHVLVVEDNRDSVESLRLLLHLFGYVVTVAYSGDEAMVAVKEAVPDVVLCDIGLPGMDGFGVVDALRHDPRTARTRMIAVTGYGQEEDRRKALSAGFDEHMVKPVDPEKLLGKLNELR